MNTVLYVFSLYYSLGIYYGPCSNAHGRTKIRQNNFQMTKIEINIGFNYSEREICIVNLNESRTYKFYFKYILVQKKKALNIKYIVYGSSIKNMPKKNMKNVKQFTAIAHVAKN